MFTIFCIMILCARFLFTRKVALAMNTDQHDSLCEIAK